MINFTPNCTLPTAALGFVHAPPVRGTMEIVSSCLTIIVLCTWSILHLKVPPQHEPQNWRQRIRWKLALVRRKLKWMAITILAPEVLMGFVCNNFWTARENTKKLQRHAAADGVPWSLTHSFFANQGGFIIHFPPELEQHVDTGTSDSRISHPGTSNEGLRSGEEPRTEATAILKSPGTETVIEPLRDEDAHPLDTPADLGTISSSARSQAVDPAIELGRVGVSQGREPQPPDELPRPNPTLFHRDKRERYLGHREEAIRKYGALQGVQIAIFRSYGDGLSTKRKFYESNVGSGVILDHLHDAWVLDSQRLVLAREWGIIETLPRLEEAEIKDRNKGDAIVKLLAVLQVGWMVTQLVVRAVYGLPSTTLEVTSVAFAACSLLMYLVQWLNLKDVAVPLRLKASRLPTELEFERFCLTYVSAIGWGTPNGPAFRNDTTHWCSSGFTEGKSSYWVWTISGAGGFLFGAIHLAAWSFTFPTPVEQVLWRASALTLLIVPLVYPFGGLANMFFDENREGFWVKTVKLLAFVAFVVTVPCYTVARGFLLVESFRSLYFLPPGAYQATWTKNAPHLG